MTLHEIEQGLENDLAKAQLTFLELRREQDPVAEFLVERLFDNAYGPLIRDYLNHTAILLYDRDDTNVNVGDEYDVVRAAFLMKSLTKR